MRPNYNRYRLASIFFPALLTLASPVWAQEEQAAHPLAIHMNQWLAGSREWTTPNPSHDPEKAESFAEFRVRWDWGPFRQQMLGRLFGVRTDGSTMLFWNLYATHNPATGAVIYQQIGRNGAYIHGEHPARGLPVAFGEIERLDTTMYGVNGQTKVTRHENVFSADGSHQALVYKQGEGGEWELENTWLWKLVAEDEVLGMDL